MSTQADPKPKRVLIAGGASGIGRALTRVLLETGHWVYFFDINELELNHTLNVHLKQYSTADPPKLAASVCDLKDVDAIRATVAKAAQFFERSIDCLVNMGGISTPQWKKGVSMEDEETFEQWRALIDTNLTAPFAVSQAVIPYMKVQNGTTRKERSTPMGEEMSVAGPSIIHIGSFRAHQSDPNQEGYAASKAGLLGLMQAQSVSCERWGIRVNLIAPGRIKVAHESKDGDEANMGWEEQISDLDIDQHSVNRAGRPKDVIDAVVYLMNAGFVTGQDITVDGGALRKKNK